MRSQTVYVAIFALVLATACGFDFKQSGKSETFSTKNGPVEFQFPAGWYQNPDKHPYDLQTFSKDQSLNTGVFLYTKNDSKQIADPRKTFEEHIEDLRSKRDEFAILEQSKTITLPGKTLTTVVYSGEKESEAFLYKFTMIEFADDRDFIPIVTQVALPDDWPKDKKILEDIVASATVRR